MLRQGTIFLGYSVITRNSIFGKLTKSKMRAYCHGIYLTRLTRDFDCYADPGAAQL